MLRAVHKHSVALRLGTVGAGNDHRLGANEAPPAILSVYLGEQLTDVLDGIVNGKSAASKKSGFMEVGVSTLPPLPVDPRTATAPAPSPLPATSLNSAPWALPSPWLR